MLREFLPRENSALLQNESSLSPRAVLDRLATLVRENYPGAQCHAVLFRSLRQSMSGHRTYALLVEYGGHRVLYRPTYEGDTRSLFLPSIEPGAYELTGRGTIDQVLQGFATEFNRIADHHPISEERQRLLFQDPEEYYGGHKADPFTSRRFEGRTLPPLRTMGDGPL